MRRVLAALLAASGPALAGAWPQEPGVWQIITTTTVYRVSTAGFDPQGRPVTASRYGKVEISPYIEVGLTPEWTLGAQPRLTFAETRSGGRRERTFGLADNDVFLRRVLARGQNDVLSAQALVGIPGGYDPDDRPALGEDNVDLEARLLYGRGFGLGGGASGFAEIQAAFRHRTGNPADQVRVDITFGVRPSPPWLLLVQTFSQISRRNARGEGSDYDVHKLQISVVRDITPSIAVQLGGYREFEGRRVALGSAVIAAVWLRF